MTLKQMTAIALAAISVMGVSACGSSEVDDRGPRAVALCRGHGGVIAFEDDIVICRDQSSHRIE